MLEVLAVLVLRVLEVLRVPEVLVLPFDSALRASLRAASPKADEGAVLGPALVLA